jgi:hypothetical protein
MEQSPKRNGKLGKHRCLLTSIAKKNPILKFRKMVGTYQKCENLLEIWQEKSNNRPMECIDF